MTLDFVRSSTLDLLLTCPQKFNLSQNEGLGAESEAIATAFGHAWHRAHHLIRMGSSIREAHALATEGYQDPQNSAKTKQKILLGLEHYQARYGGFLKPVGPDASEQEFLLKIPGIPIPIKGTKDIIAFWDANEGRGTEKWIVDHKTTAMLKGQWVQQYGVSNQFKCYYCAGKEEDPEIAGVLVDLFHVTKGVTTDRGKKGKSQAEIDGVHLYRLALRYSDFTISEWKKTVATALKALRVYESEGHFPLNAPTACSAYGSMCPFLDICACQDPAMREVIKLAFKGNTNEESGNEEAE